MATNAKTQYHNRGFLNPKKGMAVFEATVELWHPTLAQAFFKITDCNRQIALDFSYDGQEEKDDISSKLNLLIEELTKYKEQLLANSA